MFINPQVAIDEGWITGIKDPEKQVQPNAIDFTLDTVFTVRIGSMFSIAEHGKVMRNRTEMPPVLDRSTGLNFWRFKPMTFYDCLSDMYVAVPDGVVVLPLVARSSFTRNGIFLTSGFYDTGFEGHVGFVLNNFGGTANITQGTRIGQIAFVKSDNAKVYSGGYSHGQGEGKALAADDWMQKKADLVVERENQKAAVAKVEEINADVPPEPVMPENEIVKEHEVVRKEPVKRTMKKRRPASVEAALDELKKPTLDASAPVKKKKAKGKKTRPPAR